MSLEIKCDDCGSVVGLAGGPKTLKLMQENPFMKPDCEECGGA